MPTNSKEYQREYMKKRYNNDPEFRQRVINHATSWSKRNLDKCREINRRYREKKIKQTS